ncbi:MAG: type 1 glutamine amidotransferase [Thermoplasmata archaeon]|nr:type 1 glutamine amidotransferase [Thermoplasmata archaeon]
MIGITTGRSSAERYSIHAGYVAAVHAISAFPLLLPVGPGSDVDRLMNQVLSCDALLVSGGKDVDPALSRLSDPSEALATDRTRDDAEIAAILGSLESGRRVLGICRGAQLLSVAFGGSLIGDLTGAGYPGHDAFDRQDNLIHAVTADPASAAAAVLGTVTEVNSAHHQAVAFPGEGQRATAWSPDGVIEAIEGPGALGLQWHPERLAGRDERHLAPFRWLLS